jgi:hypothetical protein
MPTSAWCIRLKKLSAWLVQGAVPGTGPLVIDPGHDATGMKSVEGGSLVVGMDHAAALDLAPHERRSHRLSRVAAVDAPPSHWRTTTTHCRLPTALTNRKIAGNRSSKLILRPARIVPAVTLNS